MLAGVLAQDCRDSTYKALFSGAQVDECFEYVAVSDVAHCEFLSGMGLTGMVLV